MVRYQRLQFYRGSFSMKMVDARVQDTTGSNFIEVRYGKIPKVAILWGSSVVFQSSPIKKIKLNQNG